MTDTYFVRLGDEEHTDDDHDDDGHADDEHADDDHGDDEHADDDREEEAVTGGNCSILHLPKPPTALGTHWREGERGQRAIFLSFDTERAINNQRINNWYTLEQWAICMFFDTE